MRCATSIACPQASSRFAQCPAPTPAISAQPKRAALFRGEHFHRLAVNAGLNLPPQRPARAAAAQPNAAHRNAQLREERERVLQRIGHALQHRAHKMRRGVHRRDARKRRAHLGIEMRRALAEQIRRPLQSLAARRESSPPPQVSAS